MKTLEQFVSDHTGKYLDWDGVYGAQCVDLIDYYLQEVLGVPVAYANAVDWYGKDASYLDWTHNRWNDPNSKPPKGAIVVWGPNAVIGTGVFGHIAISLDPGDGTTFTTFDQNWPPGSFCHTTKHTFDGVIGWATKIKPIPPVTTYPLNPMSFGAWMNTHRSDIHGVREPMRLYGQYLKEAYPSRTDLQPNGRPLSQWLVDLIGEAIIEVKP